MHDPLQFESDAGAAVDSQNGKRKKTGKITLFVLRIGIVKSRRQAEYVLIALVFILLIAAGVVGVSAERPLSMHHDGPCIEEVSVAYLQSLSPVQRSQLPHCQGATPS